MKTNTCTLYRLWIHTNLCGRAMGCLFWVVWREVYGRTMGRHFWVVWRKDHARYRTYTLIDQSGATTKHNKTPCEWFPRVTFIHWVCLVPSQYPKRRLFVRYREVSKPRDWHFGLSYRFEIWQAHRQQCCRIACQISERSDNSKYKSRGFKTLRDLTKRRRSDIETGPWGPSQ